jgi:hypothetical protein
MNPIRQRWKTENTDQDVCIQDIRWIDTYLFLDCNLKIAVDLIVQSVEKLLDVGLGISVADGSPLRATSR